MSDVQHAQMILGAAMGMAALGVFFCNLTSRWVGGTWLTLLAILAALLFSYRPLLGDSLFATFDTNLMRRILIGLTAFTICVAGLSFKKVPGMDRLAFAMVAPACLLYWVFAHYELAIPRQTMLFQKVGPVALIIFAAWALIEPLSRCSPGAAIPIVIGASTAGLAFLLLMSAELQAGQMAPLIPATALGALAAAVIGYFLGWPISFARGPVLLWLTAMGALYAFTWLDTEKLPLPFLYWIIAAPVLAWVPEIKLIHRLKPWKRETLRLTLVAIPVVIVVMSAWKKHRDEAKADGDEYGIAIPRLMQRSSESV